MKIYICPRCKERLDAETDSELRKEYPFVCHNCDENFYRFEVIVLNAECLEVG